MNTDLQSLVFATTARVQVRATTTDLLGLAQQRAPDSSIFDEYPPFFWLNQISSDDMDAYFTRMDPLTTLPNFAREAAQGVAFLIGHNNREMPFGATLTGTLETAGDVTRVLADAYALREPTTAAFVNRVRAGIQKDDSVGFYGGQWICSICGRDMLTDWWECWHVPGLMYEIKDPDGGTTTVREVLAWALVKNAHLSEVSAVYDGATPGAAILAAQRAAESGHLTPQQARLLEQRYRINLPDRRLLVAGADNLRAASAATEALPRAAGALPLPQEEPMPPTPEERAQPVEVAGAAPFDPIRQIFSLAGEVDVLGFCRDLAGELPRLRAQADDGAAYRKDLIAEALAEGVRALGDAFAEETYRGLLESAPLATIKRMRDDWQATARVRLPGGRLSNDAGDPPVAPPAKDVETPNDVYRA